MTTQSLYFIGDRDSENKLIILCKDGQWRRYRECEENWTQVLLLPSKEAYDKKDAMLTDDQRYGFDSCSLHVYSNSFARNSYALLRWDEQVDTWHLIGKCIADSWWGACRLFGVDSEKAHSSEEARVEHCDRLYGYTKYDEVVSQFDSSPITH